MNIRGSIFTIGLPAVGANNPVAVVYFHSSLLIRSACIIAGIGSAGHSKPSEARCLCSLSTFILSRSFGSVMLV